MQKIIYLCVALLLTACQNQTVKSTADNTAPTLEVIGVFRDKGLDSVSFIPVNRAENQPLRHLHTTLNPQKHGALTVGERVKISGVYSDDHQIRKIRDITHVENPDKAQCEATAGNVWKPQGMAQIPACIATYTDSGKACTASTQCQGDCIVTEFDKPAVCAASSSRFGCRSTIEDFQQHGGIMCVD